MLGVVLIWGVNIPLVKAAFATLSPFVFNALRFTLAAILLSVAARGDSVRTTPGAGLPNLVMLGFIGHTAYQYLFIAGLTRTTAGNSSLILATVPLLVAIVGVALGVERPTARVWGGLLAAFAGLAVLVHAGGGASFRWTTVLGDMLVFGLGVVLGHVHGARPPMARARDVADASDARHAAPRTSADRAGRLPDLLRVEWRSVTALTWSALLFSATFAIVVAYIVWYASVQVVGGARTAAISNLVPIVTLVTAWAWLGETLNVGQVVGAAIVLLGVWFSQSADRPSRMAGALTPAAGLVK